MIDKKLVRTFVAASDDDLTWKFLARSAPKYSHPLSYNDSMQRLNRRDSCGTLQELDSDEVTQKLIGLLHEC